MSIRMQDFEGIIFRNLWGILAWMVFFTASVQPIFSQDRVVEHAEMWQDADGFALRVCGLALIEDSAAIDTGHLDPETLAQVLEILKEGNHGCYPFFYSGQYDRWPRWSRTGLETKMEVCLTLHLMQQPGVDPNLLKCNIVHSESGWMVRRFPKAMEVLMEGGEGCYILYFQPR